MSNWSGSPPAKGVSLRSVTAGFTCPKSSDALTQQIVSRVPYRVKGDTVYEGELVLSLRYLTAGESHGPALTAILEGMPAGVPLSIADINGFLQRRQLGYGRGRRMQIESDEAELLSGVRHGRTLGGPISFLIRNNDWERWQRAMARERPTKDEDRVHPEADDWRLRPVTRPRPGHADLTGALKYDFDDARNVLERASARETAMRVAVGAAALQLLRPFGVHVASHVLRLGPVAAPFTADASPPPPEAFNGIDETPLRCLDPATNDAMVAAVDDAKKRGETFGGVYEIIVWGLPPGLGSHVHWDRKLDTRLAAALMSIQATKGVEVGLGFETGARYGSESHDALFYDETRGVHRQTARSGGIEGGMTTGDPIVVRSAMKPLATLYNPLPSVEMDTLEASKGAIERSDVTAVPAAAVVAEAVVAFEVARAFLDKFGGDSLTEIRRNFEGYTEALRERGVWNWRRTNGEASRGNE